MASKKLLPCPFCGGKGTLVQTHNPYVMCKKCHVSTPMYSWTADAIAAWNRRAGADTGHEDPKKGTVPGWIPVTERMPETEETMAVICRKKDGKRSWNRAWWDGVCWHGSGSFAGVTHWMPIQLPEE